MHTASQLIEGLNDITDTLGFHEGETLYGLNLRLRRKVDDAILNAPEELDGLTDLVEAMGNVMDLFPEYGRLSLTIPEVIKRLPARLAAEAEAPLFQVVRTPDHGTRLERVR